MLKYREGLMELDYVCVDREKADDRALREDPYVMQDMYESCRQCWGQEWGHQKDSTC